MSVAKQVRGDEDNPLFQTLCPSSFVRDIIQIDVQLYDCKYVQM